MYDPWAVNNVLHFRVKIARWFYPMKPNAVKVSTGEVIGENKDIRRGVKAV